MLEDEEELLADDELLLDEELAEAELLDDDEPELDELLDRVLVVTAVVGLVVLEQAA